MKLSNYIKLQKILLAAFCASLGVFFFATYLTINSESVVTVNNNTNIPINNAPTPIPTNSVTPTNENTVTVNNNSAANVNNNSAFKPPEETGYGLIIIGGV